MASDSLRQIGNYIKGAGTNANLALKRNFTRLPVKDRARDTVSAVSQFRMYIDTDGKTPVSIDINFNKPPPEDCSADCLATACEGFDLDEGGHSVTLLNPYEIGTVRAYRSGEPLEAVQWFEENPLGGQVYVQVQDSSGLIIICYTYIVC